MMETKWKYTDPKAMPVPLKKLGDIVYTSCPWNGSDYDYISRCEVRKIEVRWYEDHWGIDYYLRTDVGTDIQSARQAPYHYEDGRESTMYDTPQEVIEDNIVRFIDEVHTKTDAIIKTMRQLGYKEPVIIDKLSHLVVHETKETGKHDERALR